MHSFFLDITINGESVFDWGQTFNMTLSDDSMSSVSSLDGGWVIEVHLSSNVKLQISRTQSLQNGFYLGLYITHSDGLDSNVEGVIGKSQLMSL